MPSKNMTDQSQGKGSMHIRDILVPIESVKFTDISVGTECKQPENILGGCGRVVANPDPVPGCNGGNGSNPGFAIVCSRASIQASAGGAGGTNVSDLGPFICIGGNGAGVTQ